MKKSVCALRLAILAALPLLWMPVAQAEGASSNNATTNASSENKADTSNAAEKPAAPPSLTYSGKGRWGAYNGETGATPDDKGIDTSTGFFQQTPSDSAWAGPVFYATLGGQFNLSQPLFKNNGKLNFSPIMSENPGLAFYLPSNEVAYWAEGSCTSNMTTGVCANNSGAASQISVSVPALYVLMPQPSTTNLTNTQVTNYGQNGLIAVAQSGGRINLGDTYVNVPAPNYLTLKAADTKAGEPVKFNANDIYTAWQQANTVPAISVGNGGVVNIVGKLVTYTNLVPGKDVEAPAAQPATSEPTNKPAAVGTRDATSGTQAVGGKPATTPKAQNYTYYSGVSSAYAVGGIGFNTHASMPLTGACSSACNLGQASSAQQPGVINLVLSEGSEFALHTSSSVTNVVMQGTTLYMSDIASAQKYVDFLHAAPKAEASAEHARAETASKATPAVDTSSYDYGAPVSSPFGGTTGGYSGLMLRVEGDLVSRGDNNEIVFNTYDGEPASTDRLLVYGQVKGEIKVLVNNLKPGAKGLSKLKTTDIIFVKGANTDHGIQSGHSELPKDALSTAKSVSAPGNFVLANRVTQGPYEYFLVHRTLDSKEGHYDIWGLSNRNGTLTPEVGAYMNVLSNANRLFVHDIQDRAATSATPFTYRVWGNVDGQRNRWKSDDGQLSATNKSVRVLLGSDLYVSNTGEYVLHFGGFWGYGQIGTEATSLRSHYTAKAKTKGSVWGGYSTLYQMDDEGIQGVFEIWFMNSKFKTNVDGLDTHFKNFSQSGSSYSAQYTRRFIVHATQLAVERNGVYDQRQWVLEPSVQMAYLGNTFQTYTVGKKGETISPIEGKVGNFMFRANVTLKVDDVQNLVYAQPVISRFLSLGYTHFTAPTQFLYDGDLIKSSGAQNTINAAAGINARFGDVWSAAAKVQYSVGRHHYQQLDLNLGMQYAF